MSLIKKRKFNGVLTPRFIWKKFQVMEFACFFWKIDIFLSIAFPKHTSKAVNMQRGCVSVLVSVYIIRESIVRYIGPSLHSMVLQEIKRKLKLPKILHDILT